MAWFACIKDGVVQSVIVATQEFIDSMPVAHLQADTVIEVFEDRPGPGFLYDSVTGLFSAPEEPG